MKPLKWAAALGIATVCVILFLNKDDVMRYQKMRQMLCSQPRVFCSQPRAGGSNPRYSQSLRLKTT